MNLFSARHCERSAAIFDMLVADFSMEYCFVPRNDGLNYPTFLI